MSNKKGLGSKAKKHAVTPDTPLISKTEDTSPQSSENMPERGSNAEPVEMFRKNIIIPKALDRKVKYWAIENDTTESKVYAQALEEFFSSREHDKT